MAGYPIEERLTWRRWVTPQLLMQKPIHRWFVFPHSFTSELVQALIDGWQLGPCHHILDPFTGAGTTALAAKEQGIPCTCYDLLPLAVLAGRAKVADYDVTGLEEAWQTLKSHLDPAGWSAPSRQYSELVERALPGKVLAAFDSLAQAIGNLPCPDHARDFFQLALLATIPQYSTAVATGGWLKWVDRQVDVTTLPAALSTRVESMLDDLHAAHLPREPLWRVGEADARQLPDADATYSAVITSPPYPNRHDYTRVFGVELMVGFLDWEGTRRLRYQSFHSHPEARPKRPDATGYEPPPGLERSLARIEAAGADRRVVAMLRGYFLDTYLCLREIERVCRPGAKIGLVLGNAQYCGESIPVDELAAQVGEQVGLSCEKLIVARYRGNSAQQMGRYGRHPSRESVVILHKA